MINHVFNSNIDARRPGARARVGIADDGVACARAEGHDLVVGWAGDGAVDVELVDDEVRLEPPACAGSQRIVKG